MGGILCNFYFNGIVKCLKSLKVLVYHVYNMLLIIINSAFII